MSTQTSTWNAELYQSSHAFVWQFGRDLLTMLLPKAVDYRRLRMIAVKQ